MGFYPWIPKHERGIWCGEDLKENEITRRQAQSLIYKDMHLLGKDACSRGIKRFPCSTLGSFWGR